MKLIRIIIFTIFLALNGGAAAHPLDSVEISLLTCSPHNEVYSLYGHTALRIRDDANHQDWAVNYGVFDVTKSFFVPRFIFGLTDYEIGIFPFDLFCYEYRYYGSSVTEQILDLTTEEKQRIFNAIAENYRPENREYRYNFFYKNCTTQARDVVYDNLSEYIEYKELKPSGFSSFRELIHEYNEEFRWARFGNDILLGVGADRSTTREEREFLPEKLMEDFDHAYIGNRKLVKQKTVIVEKRDNAGTELLPMAMSPTVITPTHIALLILVLSIIVTAIEHSTRRTLWQFDAIMMLLCGLAGIILFLMLFSQHPTVRVNLQLLLFNPLPLFFLWRMISRSRKKQTDWQFSMWIVLICLFFAGSLLQRYAEGMLMVGAALLVRNVARFLKKA